MTTPIETQQFDISADERMDPELLDRLRADPDTRVLAVRGDRAAVRVTDERGSLVLSAPSDVTGDAEWAFLGRDADGRGVLLASLLGEQPEGWLAFRDIAAQLPSHEVDLFTRAVALGRWLADSPYCPACGQRTDIAMSGWARKCPECGREHFPRTDPAVIVAISSADRQRLLLGANAAWQGKMFSCFAGFIEAGESAEETVHRELVEEAGVRVRDVRYMSSQAWPYPRSLMLGFHATVVDESEVNADGEEIIQTRWFTREEVGRGLEGALDVRLPGGVSVARHLIRDWYESGPENDS